MNRAHPLAREALSRRERRRLWPHYSPGSGRRGATSQRTRTNAASSSNRASSSGTTSGTRGATASSPTASSTIRSRRCSGSSCSRSRRSPPLRSPSPSCSAGNGARPPAGRAGRLPSSGRASCSRQRFPSRSEWRCAARAVGAPGRARTRFGVLAVLTLAASPLAFLLLALVLVGVGICAEDPPRLSSAPRSISPARAPSGSRSGALSRAGPLPLPAVQAAAAIGFCLLGLIAHLARRAGTAAPRPLRRLPGRLRGRLRSSPPRSERTSRGSASPQSRSSSWRSRFATGDRGHSPSLHSCSSSPGTQPARRSFARGTADPTVRRRATGSPRSTIPARQPHACLPRRGRGHGRPLGCRVPAEGGNPARARLVPPGRLPAEPGAVPARAGGAQLSRLAPQPRHSLRRADRGAPRLQRPCRGHAPPRRACGAEAGAAHAGT